jgi:hypothetical protein
MSIGTSSAARTKNIDDATRAQAMVFARDHGFRR